MSEIKSNKKTTTEIIGYTFIPDQWSWTLAVKKRHKVGTKFAGKEYVQELSYHKTLTNAVSALYNRVARNEGELLQKKHFEETGKIADIEILQESFRKSESVVLAAIKDLEERLSAAGYNIEGNNLNRDFLKKTGYKDFDFNISKDFE